MQLDTLIKLDLVTIFMECLYTGASRTKAHTAYLTPCVGDVDVALNVNWNFTRAYYGIFT